MTLNRLETRGQGMAGDTFGADESVSGRFVERVPTVADIQTGRIQSARAASIWIDPPAGVKIGDRIIEAGQAWTVTTAVLHPFRAVQYLDAEVRA